jgi:hypothetical protein
MGKKNSNGSAINKPSLRIDDHQADPGDFFRDFLVLAGFRLMLKNIADTKACYSIISSIEPLAAVFYLQAPCHRQSQGMFTDLIGNNDGHAPTLKPVFIHLSAYNAQAG